MRSDAERLRKQQILTGIPLIDSVMQLFFLLYNACFIVKIYDINKVSKLLPERMDSILTFYYKIIILVI